MGKVKTIAHRGHQGFYPDNCLEGIEHAIKNGSNHLELDVAKTEDDRLILAHWALNLNSTNILDYCKPNDPNDMCSGKYTEDTINKAITRFCNGSKKDQRCIVARKLQKIVKGDKRISLHVGKFKLKELQPKLSLDYEKDYIEFLGKGTSKGYLYPFRATHGNSLKEKPTIPTLEEVIEKIVKTINSNKNKIRQKRTKNIFNNRKNAQKIYFLNNANNLKIIYTSQQRTVPCPHTPLTSPDTCVCPITCPPIFYFSGQP